MAFRYFYRNDDGDIEEFTDRVQVGWAQNAGTTGLVMQAEEGSKGTCSIRVDDPDGDFTISGHRVVYVVEEDSAYEDEVEGVVYIGYSVDRTYEREMYRTGLGRTVTITLWDINSIFERRIFAGGSQYNRPAETDVERITWALTENEAALIDDYTYFNTDEPVDMDPVDLRGMSFRQLFDDCSLQSGKNWFLWQSPGGYSLWYQPRGTTDFSTSTLISNMQEDLDDYEGLCFAPAIDTKLRRDPDRVYSGIYRAYANSYVYIQNEDTAAAFARRDTFASSPTIKTKLKAIVRSERELADISTEEDVVSTSILVPRSMANCVLQGQRLQVRYSHFANEGYGEFTWMRAFNRTVRELGPDQIEIAMELTRDEPAASTGGIGAVFGILARPKGYDNLDRLYYQWVGDSPSTGGGYQPTVGLIEPLFDAGSPVAPTWTYYGWKILGTGTVNLRFRTSTIGITPTSVTFDVLKNGVVVHTVTQGNGGGHGNDCDITVTDLPVDVDDILTTAIHCTPSGVPFFQAPRGVGTNSEYFMVTGGTVV